MGVSVTFSGELSKTDRFLKKALKVMDRSSIFKKYAELGLEALRGRTPKDTGITADSWYYDIEDNGDTVTINWNNSNVNDHVNIAIILQYGHATGTGGYVKGTDYINPALKPVFDKIADDLWREVTR